MLNTRAKKRGWLEVVEKLTEKQTRLHERDGMRKNTSERPHFDVILLQSITQCSKAHFFVEGD